MSKPHRKPSLPYGWKVYVSKCYPNQLYYFNSSTGATSWKVPELIDLTDPIANSHKSREHIMEHSKNIQIRKKQRVQTPSTSNIKDDSACVSSSTETANCREVSANNLNSKIKHPQTIVKNSNDIPVLRKKISFLVSNSRKLVNQKSNKTAIVAPVIHKSEENSASSLRSITSVSGKTLPKSNLSPAKYQLKKRPNDVSCSSQKKNNVLQLKKESCKSGPRKKIVAPLITPSEELTTVGTKEQIELSNRKLHIVNKRRNPEKLNTTSLHLKTNKIPLKKDKLHKRIYPDLGMNQEKKKVCVSNKTLPETTVFQEVTIAKDLGKIVGGMKAWCTENATISDDIQLDVEMLDVSRDLSSLDIFYEPMQIDVPENEQFNSYFIVVDTNILMHDLKFVDELKDLPLEGCGPPNIFIPWVVIQELDTLKSKNNKNPASRQSANEAVRYLYSMLTTKHPRIHGQTEKMGRKSIRSSEECNDDRIMKCCLQLVDRMTSERVILLTNDKNLCNKAVINKLAVYTRETLLQHLKADLYLIKESPQSSGLKVTIPVKKPETESELKIAVDEVICRTKVLLKHLLEPFLRKRVKEVYRKSWETIIGIKLPWSLLDILFCIKMHWGTVFGYIFTKDIFNHFENIYNQFKSSKGYFCDEKQAYDTLISAEAICTQYQEKYGDKPHILQQIVELRLQCEQLCEKRIPECINRINHNTDDVSDPRIIQRNVIAVFQYIWDLINHLCGVVLDSLDCPHQFTYTKPSELPKKEEIYAFLPKFYPSLHQLKSHMFNVLNETDSIAITRFHKSLVSFVSSLQIQVNQAPVENFSVEMLSVFCKNSENRDLLQNGLRQLVNFYAVINKCIHEIGSQDRMQDR